MKFFVFGTLSTLGLSFLFLSPVATALYSPSSAVKLLDAKEFKELKKSGDPFIVKFFSRGCGHCKNFVPEYENSAVALKGIIKVVGVEDQNAMADEAISGFPTVKFIAGDVSVVYKEKRTAASVIDFATKQLNSLAKQRIGGSSSDSDAGGKKTDKAEKADKADSHRGKDVISLTDTTFENTLAKEGSEDVWFVLFYAPWCGHCKSMMPAWEKTAATLKGKVKVAQVDGTRNSMLAQHFGIQGFPTIKLFPPGGDRKWISLPKVAVSFEGERTESAFVNFAMQFAGKAATAEQLLSQAQLDEECIKGVCLVAFLPHILDSKTEGRNKLLKIYNAVLRASYSMPVKFFWSEGGEQFDVEEKLRLQFGFPAVVAINLEKNRYAVHKGTFEEESLRAFITALMAGRQAIDPLPSDLPHIKTVQPWDGKDAPEPDDEL